MKRSQLFIPLSFVILAIAAASASAATLYGSKLAYPPNQTPCGFASNAGSGPTWVPSAYAYCTFIQRTAPLSLAHPAVNPIQSSGVITQVRTSFGTPPPATSGGSIALQSFDGADLRADKVSDPILLPASPGTYAFPTRLPVTAGQLIGLRLGMRIGSIDPGGAISIPVAFEDTGSGSAGTFTGQFGTVAPGSTASSSSINVTNGLLQLAWDVEPDENGDGFGDETQDAIAPLLRRDGSRKQRVVSRKSVRLAVTSNESGFVNVSGTMRIGAAKKSTKLAAQDFPVARDVNTKIAFVVKKSLLKKISAGLKKKRTVTIKLVVVARDRAGNPSAPQTLKLTAKK